MLTISFILTVAVPDDIAKSFKPGKILEHIRDNLDECGIPDCAIEIKEKKEGAGNVEKDS